MKIVRTSVVLGAMAAALSWSAAGRADDTPATPMGGTPYDEQAPRTGTGQPPPSPSGMETQPSPGGATPYGMDDPTMGGGSPTGTGGYGTGSPGMAGAPAGTGATTPGAYGTGPYGTQPYGQTEPYGVTVTTGQTATTAAPYDPTMVGAEREREIRPNRPLLITGSAIFLGTYGASVIQALASDTEADDNNYIPLVGPWLNIAERDCQLGDCGTQEDWNNILLIGSGVAQGVGVGLAIASLIVPETEERVAKGKDKTKVAKPEVRVIPVQMGRGGAGVGAVGRF